MNIANINDSDYEPFIPDDTMRDDVRYHTINIILGATCFVFNIPLFITFITYKRFRDRYQTLIALNIADALNCLAIFFMGINRVNLYTKVLNTNQIPIRTAWECAIESWLLLHTIGDLWPPIIQLMMGLERLMAVIYPVIYKKTARFRTYIMILPTVLFVLISMIVGFGIAYKNRDLKVKYYCGRKAAFSDKYGVFIYSTNILGYFFGLFFNTMAVFKALSVTKRGKQLRRIRCTLLISLLSMILVSLPNAISIMSAFMIDIAKTISKPSVYFTCINSGINIIIYSLLNNEFRQRLIYIFLSFKSEIHNYLSVTRTNY